ncbi:MAG: carboxypeptidase-like regulatory domain-containing protein [Flavisolibacter sp.]
MRQRLLLLNLCIFFAAAAYAQNYKVYGEVSNLKLESLAFASIQVKNSKIGTISKEDGTYELLLDDGKYDLVVTMLGYKPQVIPIIVRKESYLLNIILEEDSQN